MKNPKVPKSSKYFEDINAFNKLKNSQGSDFYGDRPDVTVQDLFRGPEYLFDGKEFNPVQSSPMTGVYRVSNTDDYGYATHSVGMYKADSIRHAKLRAALDTKNVEIYLTGFYTAEYESNEGLADQIKGLEKQIKNLKTIK